jgi:hypothetical protein
VARWDQAENRGRIVGPWKPFVHPQLGPVEIGGHDPRFGIWNPPPERLAEVCANQAKVFFRIAALAPRLGVTSVETAALGGGLTRVTAIVENLGYLPTCVLASARDLPWNDPVRARLLPGEGVELAGGDADQLVGHLQGWGGYERAGTPSFARTEGAPVRRRVAWVVRGRGSVRVEAGAARVGRVEAQVEVGG